MSRKYLSQRTLAYRASALAFLIAAVAIFLIWQGPDESPARAIQMTVDLAGCVSLSVLAFLITWHAGDRRGATSIALAIAFISLADAWIVVQATQFPHVPHLDVMSALLFALGAGFFLRASQLFPRELVASDIASSALLQRIRPLRAALAALLRPPVTWALAFAVAGAIFCFESTVIRELFRLAIVGAGIIYFYIGYRVGDTDTRRKVLWFLEAAVGSLVIGVVVIGILAVLGEGGSPILRQVLAISVSAINTAVIVSCLYAAVFYAGAISPALVVRKTFVLGATVAILLFAFGTVEALIADQITRFLGITDRLSAALFGATCGLAFGPMKRKLEAVLRRMFPAWSVEAAPNGAANSPMREKVAESGAKVD